MPTRIVNFSHIDYVMNDLRLNGLRDGANLVDLQKKTIARLLLDGRLDTERVRDGQVIADDLNAGLGCEVGPCLPVVLVKRVLDRDDGVLFDVAEVDIRELNTSNPFGRVRIRVLEVEIVLSFLVKLGRCNIECDLDLAFIAGFLDGLCEELECFIGAGNVGRKSSLITHVDSCELGRIYAAKLQQI